MMLDLLSRLDAAASGYTAVHGDEPQNIFADAAKEIRHLREMEEALRGLDTPFPTRGIDRWQGGIPLETFMRKRESLARDALAHIREPRMIP